MSLALPSFTPNLFKYVPDDQELRPRHMNSMGTNVFDFSGTPQGRIPRLNVKGIAEKCAVSSYSVYTVHDTSDGELDITSLLVSLSTAVLQHY